VVVVDQLLSGISIRSGDICDRNLKLSEIVPRSAPKKIKVQAPKIYQNFHPCLAAYQVDKFGGVIPMSRESCDNDKVNLGQVRFLRS